MNVTRSLLDDIRLNKFNGTDMCKGWRRGDYQKKCWNCDHQGEGNEADPNIPGWRRLDE
jgi:hypothetical protein